ncbi:MAG TPA: hypothetical protein VF721_06795 [Pyrinomonadaceae bacterium]|jgi:hypothetical protein
MNKIICFLFLSLLLVLQANAAQEKAQVLENCRRLFGDSVDEKLNLFEVNQQFVLRAEFSEKGKLVKILVEPKYFYEEEHPEWTEPKERPHLANSVYADVIAKINSIKPFGNFLRKKWDGVITNSTDYRREYYKNAVLEYGESFYFDITTDKQRVRFVRIEYK